MAGKLHFLPEADTILIHSSVTVKAVVGEGQ